MTEVAEVSELTDVVTVKVSLVAPAGEAGSP